jgi:hypothetical protein
MKQDRSKRNAIRETQYLISIPGMRASIKRGMRTPMGKLLSKIKWPVQRSSTSISRNA